MHLICNCVLSFSPLPFPLPSLPSPSGVNMYAMLTGCLPYTVEPFNITALHAKMLDNKMNAIPDRLSPGVCVCVCVCVCACVCMCVSLRYITRVVYNSLSYCPTWQCSPGLVVYFPLHVVTVTLLFYSPLPSPPLPSPLECRDLLCQLLTARPEERISMSEIFQHPWLTAAGVLRFAPHPYPNNLSRDMVNMDIVNHIVHHIRVPDTSQVTSHHMTIT